MDDDGKDQGANVRQKAKDITNLLQDEGRLREERRARASMRDRMIHGHPSDEDNDRNRSSSFDADENERRRSTPKRKGGGGGDDDGDLRRAIEESKRSAAAEQAQRQEESEIAQAIRLSEEEEARRAKAVQDSNANSLFDDTAPSSSNNNNNNLISLSDPNPYTVGLQPQYTAFQPQQQQFVQPQFTSFNPYQQQAEQEALQAEYMRQQQAFLQQQQQQQQQEEWMRQQQMLQLQQQQQQQQSLFAPAQPLAPQPTGFGSNNPFAPQAARQPSPYNSSPTSPSSTSGGPSFNLPGTYDHQSSNMSLSVPSTSSPAPAQQQGPGQGGRMPAVKTRQDENSHLASLFANRDDGQDTFGNVGALRYVHALSFLSCFLVLLPSPSSLFSCSFVNFSGPPGLSTPLAFEFWVLTFGLEVIGTSVHPPRFIHLSPRQFHLSPPSVLFPLSFH